MPPTCIVPCDTAILLSTWYSAEGLKDKVPVDGKGTTTLELIVPISFERVNQ